MSDLKDDKSIRFPNPAEQPKLYSLLISDNEIELELQPYYSELKYSTQTYLESIWVDLKDNIHPHPILWVESPGEQYFNFQFNNLVFAPKFGFIGLEEYLKWYVGNNKSFTSVYNWSPKRDDSDNSSKAYQLIDKHIELLKQQIEKDNKIGLFTKKKLDRLNKQYQEDLRIYETYLKDSDKVDDSSNDDIFDLVFGGKTTKKKKTTLTARIEAEKGLDKNLIVISGKAGSGKTFEMLLLIKKLYEDNIPSYYLTYNKLLRDDINVILNKYQIPKKTVTKTLHQFFFSVAKNLRLLKVMTKPRVEGLISNEKRKCKLVENYLTSFINKEVCISDLKEDVFHNKEDKEYFLLFKDYLRKEKKQSNIKESKEILRKKLYSYSQRNESTISNRLNREVFFSDYHNVLENIYLAITDPKALYEKLDIKNISKEEWSEITQGKAEYSNDYAEFKEMINRSLRATIRYGKVLFVDEAQDCHPLEKDILLSIWKNRNIVVCSGGKEQLIRYDKECNWRINDSTRRVIHNIINIEKRNKTYRMKPALVKLCNFIAKKFDISFDLSAHNTKIDDEGSVIIELNDNDYSTLNQQVHKLVHKGEYNDLTPYESILFMSEPSAKDLYSEQTEVDNVYIDSHNNVRYSTTIEKRSRLFEIVGMSENQIYFHNQLNASSKEDHEPDYATSDRYRSIMYESCRGLEAWSAVCLDIDLFFDRKFDEETANLFLSDDLLLTEDERRTKYAATWVLMALTRAVDTLYIHVNNPNSRFGKVLQKFVEQSE